MVVVLAACSSSPQTGGLTVTLNGLPTGLNGSVTVAMGRYSHTVTSTTTLSGLAPGTSSITPQAVTLRGEVAP